MALTPTPSDHPSDTPQNMVGCRKVILGQILALQIQTAFHVRPSHAGGSGTQNPPQIPHSLPQTHRCFLGSNPCSCICPPSSLCLHCTPADTHNIPCHSSAPRGSALLRGPTASERGGTRHKALQHGQCVPTFTGSEAQSTGMQLRQGTELAALHGAQGSFILPTVTASPARRVHDTAPGAAGTKQVLGSPRVQDRLTFTL